MTVIFFAIFSLRGPTMRPVNRHVVNSASSPSHYHHHGNMIRADAFPVPPSRGEERRVYSRNQGPLVRFLLCRTISVFSCSLI